MPYKSLTAERAGCTLDRMIQVTQGVSCEWCNQREAVVLCNGCGKPLCKECRIFDIWCYGCGHGNAMVFCEKCYDDPSVNLWRVPD